MFVHSVHTTLQISVQRLVVHSQHVKEAVFHPNELDDTALGALSSAFEFKNKESKNSLEKATT